MSDTLECLVGQLISSTKSLQHELTELKRDIKEDIHEVRKNDAEKIDTLQKTVDDLVKTVDNLVSLKNKGAGILIAVAMFSAFVSWCVTHFFTK